MFARTWSVALLGLTGNLVEVEAQIANGLPGFTLVGKPDTSLNESRARVKAAVESCRVKWPNYRVTVGLSPAPLPKSGSGFDLAIAMAVLGAANLVRGVADVVFLGELGLDGRIRSVRGLLPAIAHAAAAGHRRFVVPVANEAEAALIPDCEVRAFSHLAGVLSLFGAHDVVMPPVPSSPPAVSASSEAIAVLPDMADVVGQGAARTALEVAAAGGHHLLMTGPPGAGKTMLAARLPGLLPELTDAEALAVTSIHSVAGTFDADVGLIRRAPFQAPHHTASQAAIAGGGSGLPRPGAASLAHCGVLFLDEAPEFKGQVLEVLRQPLEDGSITIARAHGTATFPARFQLVMAANPCPCGQNYGRGDKCTCSPLVRRGYLSKISGPVRDRVDLQIEVPPVTLEGSVFGGEVGESSATIAARVAQARAAARERLTGTPWTTNAQVPGVWIRRRIVSRAAMESLTKAVNEGRLTLRGADRVLRVACTLADLAGVAVPGKDNVNSAFALRMAGQAA